MPSFTQANNLGDLLKYEAPNLYSRDQVTVASGQNLELGSVVGTITATAKRKRLDPAATDGSQVPSGILIASCDASLADRDDGLVIARHAIVATNALVWPSGITPEQIAAATAALTGLGVLIRQSV